MAEILEGFSYKVCSIFPEFVAFGLFVLVVGIYAIVHQELIAMLQGHLRFHL